MSADLPAPKSLNLEENVAENRRRWLQQYRLYMQATEKDKKSEKLQCAMFLTLAGEHAIEVYNTFSFTEEEKDKIEPLVQKFEQHCTPKKNPTFERYVLAQRKQKPGETFDLFVTDLRKLIKNCEHNDITDSVLKDKIIEGLHDEHTRARLLRETDLNLNNCISICRSSEAAQNQLKVMSNEETKQTYAVSINSRQNDQRRDRSSNFEKYGRAEGRSTQNKDNKHTCGRCGYKHGSKKCPAMGQQCNTCHGWNHFAKKCKTRSLVHTVNQNEAARFMDAPYSHNSDLEFVVYTVNDKTPSTEPWIVPMTLNSTVLPLKLDTGSDVNILSYIDYQQLRYKPKLQNTQTKLTAYAGSEVPVKGQCIITVRCKQQQQNALFIISPASVQPLASRQLCEQLGLIKRVFVVNNGNADKAVDKQQNDNNILSEYSDLFEGLGCLPGSVKIKLQDNAEPVVDPCRKVPFA